MFHTKNVPVPNSASGNLPASRVRIPEKVVAIFLQSGEVPNITCLSRFCFSGRNCETILTYIGTSTRNRVVRGHINDIFMAS